VRRTAPLLIGSLLAAGCGGGIEVGGKLPACAAHPATRITRPASLPGEFPLPKGTILTKVKQKFDRVNLRGRFRGDVKHARGFFQQRLPERGFLLDGGDSGPDFAEESFVGNGVRGFVKLHRYEACDGVVRMLVTIKP